MKILSVSDVVENRIYSSQARQRFPDVDLVISCGDLPYYYVEYMVDAFPVPVFYVRGNHAGKVEYGHNGKQTKPEGAVNLHRRVVRTCGITLAGFEGSINYNNKPYQYTQMQMWFFVVSMLPRFLWNRIRRGSWLDILITHAPSWGIQDQADPAHRGFKALRWLVKTIKPTVHFHGHINTYIGNRPNRTRLGNTLVINTHGYALTEIDTTAIRSSKMEHL